ncbi:MAG: hypothetical protein V4615_05480 [Bacteroidota bacterium]
MAKQQPKQQPAQAVKKQPPPSKGGDTFTYVIRNLVIVLALAFVLFGVDRMNKKGGELQDKYREFQQLRQSGGNQQRMEELYREIMDIQNDTSFLKKITRGYYWAIHDMAIGGSENVKEIKNKADKPLTREDKFAMRIGFWPFIDYINKNTPDSAVIYLPEGDSATSNNSKWSYIYDPEWMEYFIYPRLCVAMGREQDHPDLAKRVTHVVIIEGKGYDKLHYDVPMNLRPKEDVLPIDLPQPQNP